MRERFRVAGGASLRGQVRVVGAKNSALKLMAGTLLAVGRTRLTNVPNIVDVTIMAELLRRLGCEVDWRPDDGVVEIDVPERIGHRADYELVRALRASICVLGPLIARVGEADVAVPGGDAIGSRGLDLHAEGLEALGAKVHVAHGYLIAAAPQGLHGASVHLEFPSVGATENVLMASVLATGHTRIENAAREPEIADIAEFLVSMGAHVSGAGTSTIEIDGVERPAPDGVPRRPRPHRRRQLGVRGGHDSRRRGGRRRPGGASGDLARPALRSRVDGDGDPRRVPGGRATGPAPLGGRRHACPTPGSRPTCSRSP